MVQAEVQVEGLREFRSAIRKVDSDLPKDMRRAMRHDVADPVARRVRSRVPVGPGRGGHWRDIIRGGATQRNAYVQWGRAKVPYAGWVEFGGQLPSKASGRPARVRRPTVKDGRFVYPTVRENAPMAREAAARVLNQTMRRARLTLDQGGRARSG